MNYNLLKAKMVENGVTQAQTAQDIGISVAAFSRKLQGKIDFKLSEIIRLCNYLRITNPCEIFLCEVCYTGDKI